MDVKAKIEELTSKITGDQDLMEKFKKDPAAAVSELVGADLPEGAVDKVVDAVKAKLGAEQLGGIAGKLKNLL